MIRPMLGVSLLMLVLAGCYRAPSQLPAVERLVGRSTLVRIACLDANGDGRIDGGDARGVHDITGDGAIDGADRAVIEELNISLPNGRPAACEDEQPAPDWQVSWPADVDCAGGRGGLFVLAVGGGAVELDQLDKAAGVRWMMSEIGVMLYERGIPHQLASVAPGLGGTEHPNADAEAWAAAYMKAQLRLAPCLRIVLLGHSHGGASVTALAAALEEAGLGDKVLVTIPIDRVAALYGGNREAMPQDVPVFNVYQQSEGPFTGRAINQPNVENWDASEEQGPANGQEGGRLTDLNHLNIDNSEAILERIRDRVLWAACAEGWCR